MMLTGGIEADDGRSYLSDAGVLAGSYWSLSFSAPRTTCRSLAIATQYWSDAVEPALERRNPLRRALRVAGGEWKNTLSNAWWRGGFRGTKSQQKCPEERPLYAWRVRRTTSAAILATTITQADPRDQLS